MPTLDEHPSTKYVKMMFIGDSGTGKTGALVSLLQDGYKLKILDMDNGLDSLKVFARKAQVSLKDVEFETYRDEYKASANGLVLKGTPKAFVNSLGKLTEWSVIEDDKVVLVVDSLSAFGRAAFEWAKGMQPLAKDQRNWYGTAQNAIEDTLALLTGEALHMNVIVISHVNYREIAEGMIPKGYATSIGNALGPKIPKYFNTLLVAESIGTGTNVKRKIKTAPTGMVDAKVPGLDIGAELPLETGLATVFKALKAA
jgi:hypothetical protein